MTDPNAIPPTPEREPDLPDDAWPNTQRVPRYVPGQRPDDVPMKRKPKVEDDPWGRGR